MSPDAESWHRAGLCIALLCFAPGYLGGAVIRMRASPLRVTLLQALNPLNPRHLHPTVSDDQLFGGMDATATLKSGQHTVLKGLFTSPCHTVLSMSERCGPELAAKLARQIDQDAGHCVVALDEGANRDECTPPALTDRLPFHILPEGRMPPDWAPVPVGTADTCPADVTCQGRDLASLTLLAAQFGIDSLRAPLLALKVARVHAAFHNRTRVISTDVEMAASLVYAHKATHLPPEPDECDSSPPQSEPQTDDSAGTQDSPDLPEGDMLVDVVKARIPADILAGLVPAGTARTSTGSGAGRKRKGNRRGRPLPARSGRLGGQSRIDLIATLRVAAPWQPMRRQQQPGTAGLLIRPSDIRLKRYQEQSDRLLIFTVDASGSAAVSRLNEAKGAIELLLAQAYAARDHVALVSFRGKQAEALLPPTRSLVQTKRRLVSLPGGGGTPLATGLQTATLLATQSRGRGLTPTIVVLTDGRANVTLDGTADRLKAAEDANLMARAIRSQKISTLVIDMSVRAQDALKVLTDVCDGQYLALPRADARSLTGAVSTVLDG